MNLYLRSFFLDVYTSSPFFIWRYIIH